MASDHQKLYQTTLRRWQELRNERQSWFPHWQQLGRFFAPRAGRFVDFDASAPFSTSTAASVRTNRGEKKHGHIYDNSPLRSVDVGVAGLIAGMTSPARPWFRLRTPDESLNERHNVRAWLHFNMLNMRRIFAESNTYRALRRIYEELFVFGTGATILLPDFNTGVRHHTTTIGEYALGLNGLEEVDSLYRQLDMTVEQLVDKFGFENCSQKVQNLYDEKNFLQWIPVLHGIEPRKDRNPMKFDNQNMPWQSFYLEIGGDSEKFLRMSGHRDFPVLAPRWKVNGHDFYGEAPAMRALGDVMQLQQEQYRKAQAIDYQTQPPLQVPSSLSEAVKKGPGSYTIVDGIQQKIQPAWEVDLNLQNLLNDIIDVRQRVAQAMFEDIFLMFTTTRRGVQPPTAEEIVAQQEEKLLMLGPVLENLHDELLGPLVEKTFAIMLEGGLVPPPPPELEGQPLNIEFVSTLAQAQKLIGLSNLDRMVGTIVNLSSVAPSALDKLNTDEVVNAYADALGIDPDLIVADEDVALIRQQKVQQQQQAELSAALPAVAKSVKDLGETDVANANTAVQALSSIGGTP